MDTEKTYIIRNVGSGLDLVAADGNVQQGTSDNSFWTLKDAGDGYYYITSVSGGNLTLEGGKADNGTNISISSEPVSDANLFKFVSNGDGTVAIVTKVSEDNSGVGVTAASKESGANVIEWTCNESDDQKWQILTYIAPIQGKLVKNLNVQEDAYYQFWSIDSSAGADDLVFGDREVKFVTVPDALIGAERIVTSCDAKKSANDLAEFTAAENVTVYVGLDSRVAELPAWMSSYEKTDMTAVSDNDVTFVIYKTSAKSGEKVTLGTNGQSASCVNYTVFVTADSSNVRGDVNGDGAMNVADLVQLEKWLLAVPGTRLPNWKAGDLCQDGIIDVYDLVQMRSEMTLQ